MSVCGSEKQFQPESSGGHAAPQVRRLKALAEERAASLAQLEAARASAAAAAAESEERASACAADAAADRAHAQEAAAAADARAAAALSAAEAQSQVRCAVQAALYVPPGILLLAWSC